MNKFSGWAKGLAAVLMAAGLLAGSAIPASAAPSSAHHVSRTMMDTGWG
jgi:hypothetical protein